MSYDPTELTPRDEIRGIAVDTSDPFWVDDATYDTVISKWGVPASEWSHSPKFLRATAEIVRRVAGAIEQDITSYTTTGDMSVSWGDRTRTLRALAISKDAEAAAMEAEASSGWGVVTVRSNFLTGSDGGG